MTQKELAEKAGVALRTVSSLEQGLYEPVWSTVIALSEALAVDCRAFLKEPGEIAKPQRGRLPKATPSTPPAEELHAQPRQGRPRKGQ